MYEIPEIKMPVVLLHMHEGKDATINKAVQSAHETDTIVLHDFVSGVEEQKLTACVPNRNNYEFLGWYTAPGIYQTNGASGEGVYQLNANGEASNVLLSRVTKVDAPVSDVYHLYANWRETSLPYAEIQVEEIHNPFKELIHGITFGLFFKKSQRITISAYDDALLPAGNTDYMNRGVQKVEYYLAQKPMNFEELNALTSEWITYTAPFTVDPEKKLIVYVKVVDQAGNMNYCSTDGLILDAIAPKVSQISENTIYCLEKTVTVSDNHLERVEISYVDAIDDGMKDATTIVSANSAVQSYLLDENLLAANKTSASYRLDAGTKDRIYSIKAIDKAGNETIVSGIRINKVHTFTYAVNGQQEELTAICAVDSCNEYHTRDDLKVSLSANDAVYNAEAHIAKKQVCEAFENSKAGEVSEITYYKAAQSGEKTNGDQLEGEPVEVGHYYASLTVTSTTGEKASLFVPFDIETAEITSLSIEDDLLDYTGNEVGPQKIKVIARLMVNGQPVEKELVEGHDFVFTNQPAQKKVLSATRAGVYTVEATGIGNYAGSVSADYVIREGNDPVILGVESGKQYCKNKNVTIMDDNLQYVKVTKRVYDANKVFGNEILVDETDQLENHYQITLTGSKFGTIYKIIARDVTGNEVCYDDITVNEYHTIVLKNVDKAHAKAGCEIDTCGYHPLSDELVVSISANDLVYDGQPHGANVSTSNEWNDLIECTQEDVVYYQTVSANELSDGQLMTKVPTEAGHYYALSKLKVVEGANAGKQIDIRCAFTIQAKKLEKLTLSENSVTYTGEAHKPGVNVTVKLGQQEVELVEGIDYILEYTDHVSAGVGHVTVTGIGNYQGTLTESFLIQPDNATFTVKGYEGIYDAEEHQIQLTVDTRNEDYEIYYATEPLTTENYKTVGNTQNPSQKEPGELKVYFYVKSDNFVPITGYETITIHKIPTELKAENQTVTYNGKPQNIDASVAKGDGTIKYTYYLIQDNNKVKLDSAPVDAGVYEVVLETNESEYYAKTTQILRFVIKPKEVQLSWSDSEFYYDKLSHKVVATVINKANETDDVSVGIYQDNEKTEIGSYLAKALVLTGKSAKNYVITQNSKAEQNFVIRPQVQHSITKEEQFINETAINAGLKVSQKGSKIQIAWGKVKGADGYEVFVQYCGKKYFKKPEAKTNHANVTKVVVKKIGGKKLNLKKNYKVYIQAYKMMDGEKVIIARTITAHIVGHNNKSQTNVAKVVVQSKKKLNLSVGKSSQIKAKTVLVDKKKKPLSDQHAKELRYRSSNKKIVSVSKTGKIKALKKGKADVYVYARNGFAQKIKVTVK